MNHYPIAFNATELRGRLASSISYQEYNQDFTAQLSQLKQEPADNPRMVEYLHINNQRMKRVEKTYTPSDELLALLALLPDKLYWLVISEPWCGDAAQSLPILATIAPASAGKIELRMLYRDQNPDLIDAFHYNGTRSIPRLIQLDCNFQVTGTWGPRPAEAQTLVEAIKSDPAIADTYGQSLHKWYAQDKQKAVQNEIISLLETVVHLKLECQP